MAEMLRHNKETGVYDRYIRNDAVKHKGRWIVPTSDATKWVNTWAEFKEVGGIASFSEDQAEIELLLPEPYKFSIGFNKAEEKAA